MLVTPLAAQLSNVIPVSWWLATVLIGGLLVFFGLLDDRFSLSWSSKLGFQIIVATLMFLADVRLDSIQGVQIPLVLNYFLTVGWFVGFMNAFNLIDGMDGLASGLAAIAALGLAGFALLRSEAMESLVLLAIAGSCIGFLRYNFHPAKVFLGDCGSMFLGFALASISLVTSTKSSTLAALGVPLLAIGVPIFDTMLAVWRRSMRGVASRFLSQGARTRLARIMSADTDHLHHRLLKSGLNQRKVALLLYGANAALVALGLLNVIFSAQALGISIIAFVVGSYVVVRHLARVELWDSGSALLLGLRRPSRTVAATLLYPLLDAFALTFALCFSLLLAHEFRTFSEFRAALTDTFPLWCGIPFVCLFLCGTYNRVWSRARVSEFFLLVLSLAAGFLVAAGVDFVLYGTATREFALITVLAFGTGGALITGVRAIPRTVQDIMGQIDQSAAYPDRLPTRVLVYGAGSRGLLYLKHRAFSASRNASDKRVIGFVDDDLNLRKRFVHGHRVLGTGDELRAIIEQSTIQELVIAANLPDEKRREILEVCGAYKVRVVEWTIQEAEVVAGPVRAKPRVDKAVA